MMARPEPWLMAAAAALSAAIAVTVVIQGIAALREWHLRRDAFGTLRDGKQPLDTEASVEDVVVRARSRRRTSRLMTLATKLPGAWDLNHLIVQSGLKWTFEGFVSRVILFSVVAGVFSLVLFRSFWVALAMFLLAGVSPWFYVRWRKRKRLLLLEMQLPEAIDLIARAVRAGHPLSAGLGMAAEEGPEPLATEFRITFDEQKFGLPFEEALMGLGDRVEVVDVRILITAILVQREVGGNLSEILETISETMRSRFNLKRQVRVYTAQGRMSGYTLAALPIIVGLVITIINPDYMQLLLHETLGQWMLGTAGFLQLIGFLWIRRIVDVRY